MDRQALFEQMVREFPDSPMGHFSLGRLHLDEQRWTLAVESLSRAVSIDPTYAAAWVALGDAHAGRGERDGARTAWTRALGTPLGQRDVSLQADLEQRLRDLEDFG